MEFPDWVQVKVKILFIRVDTQGIYIDPDYVEFTQDKIYSD